MASRESRQFGAPEPRHLRFVAKRATALAGAVEQIRGSRTRVPAIDDDRLQDLRELEVDVLLVERETVTLTP